LQGMPRRVPDYLDAYGFDWMNLLSSLGAFLLGASTLPFLWNAWHSWRHGDIAGDNPWDGHTLEWATPSPPPAGNFLEPLPPIRSNRPVWDRSHPDHGGERHGASVT
ncbi:MAG: cytochrome ubiquinol oxidase subunit I, partial [Acidimicrobiales bacterium]